MNIKIDVPEDAERNKYRETQRFPLFRDIKKCSDTISCFWTSSIF